MLLDMELKGNILVVRPEGELDLTAAETFRKKVDEAMAASGALHLLIALEKVEFIDSSGLGAILGRYKQVTDRKGRVALAGASPAVKRVLELAGLPRIMKLYREEKEALREMAAEAS